MTSMRNLLGLALLAAVLMSVSAQSEQGGQLQWHGFSVCNPAHFVQGAGHEQAGTVSTAHTMCCFYVTPPKVLPPCPLHAGDAYVKPFCSTCYLACAATIDTSTDSRENQCCKYISNVPGDGCYSPSASAPIEVRLAQGHSAQLPSVLGCMPPQLHQDALFICEHSS